MPSPIPFLDLVTPHRELQDEILAVVRQALSTAVFTNGPMLLASGIEPTGHTLTESAGD